MANEASHPEQILARIVGDDLHDGTMIKNLIWDLDGALFDRCRAFNVALLATLNDVRYAADPEWVLNLARIEFIHCAPVFASYFLLTHEDLD